MAATKAVTWGDLVAQAPILARAAQRIFESHPHHVIATTKRDGSPRVGGTNVFFSNGNLWIGAMPSALRNRDLRRDPRCAIHSAPLDEHLHVGDVRLDLLAEELVGEEALALLRSSGHEGEGVVFVLRVSEISLVRVEASQLVIDSWDPVAGGRTARLG